MTPLKFRAWHKTPCYDNKNSIDFGKCSMTYWEMGSGLDNSWFFKNALAVMQSTGLKDKNGKEIFEGDIVMWPDTESEYVDVGVGEVKVAETSANTWGPVVFKDAAFGIESPGGEVAKKGWYSLKEFLYDYCPPEDIEVIGNIYENPDLLPS